MSFVTPQLSSAVAAVEAAVAASIATAGHRLGAGFASDASGADAVELLAVTERLRRLAAVCVVDAVGEVHDSRVHYDHGHTSGAAMARHLGRLSGGEGARLDKIRKMIAACELLADAWRAGELSLDQAGVLARGFANPRVRDKFIDEQPRFLKWCDRPLKFLNGAWPIGSN